MTFVNFYACVMSAWMTVFAVNESQNWVIPLDTIVFASFTLDIIFTCCLQYRDLHGQLVTSHKAIIYRYFITGWLVIDVLSTFPFQYLDDTQKNGYIVKLLRLLRLPRILKVFKVSNFDVILKYLTNRLLGSERIQRQVMIRKSYQIITLVMMTILLVYFIGVLFLFAVDVSVDTWELPLEATFFQYIPEDKNNVQILAIMMYYAMTTLAKIGYGDYFPHSD